MNNAEIIKGIEDVIGGLHRIKDAFMSGESEVAPIKETSTETPSLEELEKMGYNEFKKYAASLGVKCTGTRDQIMQRVLEALEIEGSPKSDEPVEDEAPATKKAKKSAKDEFDKQAEEIAKDTDVEDILEALSDVDIEANEGNCVEKLAYALREGLIALDDEEDEEGVVEDEEVEDEVEESEEDVEITEDSYFEDYDVEHMNNPEDMSKKRARAVKSKMAEILESFESGELTVKEIKSYIEDNATEDEEALVADGGDLENLALYMELVKKTIDEDGEEHEPSDPYEIGGENLCCGHILKYSKSTKKYICEICGTEYEAE